MSRFPAALVKAASMGLAAFLVGPAQAADPASPLKAGFHFKPGEKLRMRVDASFEFTELAAGGDREDLFFKGRQSSTFEITDVKAAGDAFSARIAPVAFEYQMGDRTLSFKDGKLAKSKEAEESRVTIPTKPYEVSLKNNGLVVKVEESLGPSGYFFTGPMLSDPVSLLGWLGPMPDKEMREESKWGHSLHVLVAHATGLPLDAAVSGVQKKAEGWKVAYTIQVDRKNKNYAWLKSYTETGLGSLELDKDWRPVKATVDWGVKSDKGKTIGVYRWSCDFIR